MTQNKTVTVLIVEDSPSVQILLESIISADSRLTVLAIVPSAEKALPLLEQLKPDIISMDIRLPGMDGLEATRCIMRDHPTPIVVVSSHLDSQELNVSFNALKAGALAVQDKPVGPGNPDFERCAAELCTKLVIMSRVKVIRRWARLTTHPEISQLSKPLYSEERRTGNFKALGIVASTGGPKALVTVLNALGADFSLPILVVQHITASFLTGFVHWLDQVVTLEVLEAQDGMYIQPGKVYLAPAERHLSLRRGRLLLETGPLVSYQCPSGTVLLNSMAEDLGAEGIGVILTGMGDDGAAGLLAMRQAGALTLAEAESTAVVYGMPAVAARLGAVETQLPLDEMGPHLRKLVMREEVSPI